MDYHALQHHQSYQNQTNAHEKNLKFTQFYEKTSHHNVKHTQVVSHTTHSPPKLKSKQELRIKFAKKMVGLTLVVSIDDLLVEKQMHQNESSYLHHALSPQT